MKAVESDFHEGDMAEEIVEYLLRSMPFDELMHFAERGLTDEVKSWPPEKIRRHYEGLTGEPQEWPDC